MLSSIRNYLYDSRLLPVTRAGCPVISIGNITWGGTGKTSLVVEVATFLQSRNTRVAVVSRGYGRKTSGLFQVSNGKDIFLDWERAGDEPFLIASKVTGAMVVVAENRVDAFRYLQQYEPEVILLDDAFQHRRAHRDLDIVLVDAGEDITQLRVLPFGKLREGLSALNRAHAIVLTHYSSANERTLSWVNGHVSVPVFHADYLPEENSGLRGKRIAAFCGLASPHHFFALLRAEGAELVLQHEYADHYHYRKQDLEQLAERSTAAGAEAMVTTEKDLLKIDSSWVRMPLRALSVRLKLSDEQKFFHLILSCLEQCVIR